MAARYFDEAAFQRARLQEAAEASTTFFDVAFAPMPGDSGSATTTTTSSAERPPLLLAADSDGRVRAYLSAAVAATWLTSREAEPSSDPVLAWRAHGGACYRLALMPRSGLLLTSGDDGFVRGWRLSEVGEAAAAAAAGRREEDEEAEEMEEEQQRRRPASAVRRREPLGLAGDDDGGDSSTNNNNALPRPAFEARLPQLYAHRHPPAAQALAVDDHGGREPAAFCGASDGGLFCLSGLGRGKAEVSPVGGTADGGGGGAGGCAGVLAVDVCPSTGALASGGEDGVVRVWQNPRKQHQQQQPVASFAVGQEVGATTAAAAAGAAGAAAAAAAASPCPSSSSYVSALRFGPGTGGWLVAGTGAGEIELYSLPMRALARRATAAAASGASAATAGPLPPLVPQALLLRPGEILAAGTSPALVSHRFSLDPPSEVARCEVATDSAFALASSSPGGGGVIAVAGAGATIELLSAQAFTRLGLVRPDAQAPAL